MTKVSQYLVAIVLFLVSIITSYAQEIISVEKFNKAIISPHIQVTFEEGPEESVTIESASVSRDKINIEVEGKTLRIYLDGAKMITKTEKEYNHKGWKTRKPIYKGTQVVAKVTYKNIKELSIRGEEIIVCKSPIEQEDFKLKVYGEPKITMNALKTEGLNVTMYGEGYLEVKEGSVDSQKYTVYGEGEVNTLGMNNGRTKITAYGEGNFRINVSDNLKVTAYGEATVAYNGNPSINKGIIIGKAKIQKMK
ncbi:head GIN domain-containing protein [Aquimarina gracilis]|uniref:Head GIN domain-containing protein n=1 Tax=Aquimarina gracilis TaxID=874422 RepID=A0ABU5ZZC1_9FLAO|nr:head GIN domain-containing protein [Aquimarina gracilis]MEB3347207.1 head GIN domain-containing protein [Aquimarina gracilis]